MMACGARPLRPDHHRRPLGFAGRCLRRRTARATRRVHRRRRGVVPVPVKTRRARGEPLPAQRRKHPLGVEAHWPDVGPPRGMAIYRRRPLHAGHARFLGPSAAWCNGGGSRMPGRQGISSASHRLAGCSSPPIGQQERPGRFGVDRDRPHAGVSPARRGHGPPGHLLAQDRRTPERRCTGTGVRGLPRKPLLQANGAPSEPERGLVLPARATLAHRALLTALAPPEERSASGADDGGASANTGSQRPSGTAGRAALD